MFRVRVMSMVILNLDGGKTKLYNFSLNKKKCTIRLIPPPPTWVLILRPVSVSSRFGTTSGRGKKEKKVNKTHLPQRNGRFF